MLLSKNDLLLIGAGFRENWNCQYTASEFAQECASHTFPLGTKESVWKTDGRSIAIGLSKYLGITVTGTQKLIPQTTIKQHILDKWTTQPLRSNPGILNQYIGLEISHCTGNARRITLGELMLSRPVWAILDRQIPDWFQKPWGSALTAALQSVNPKDIFIVWREFAAHRSEIADLVCCVLELLDGTGGTKEGEFKSALLFDNQELAVSVTQKFNDWTMVLKDTHLTGAYVITNEICIECEVPDHSTSTYKGAATFTVLQLRVDTAGLQERQDLALRGFDKRLYRVDCGTSDIVVCSQRPLGRDKTVQSLFRVRAKPHDCSKIVHKIGAPSKTPSVYLRASTVSRHGKNDTH